MVESKTTTFDYLNQIFYKREKVEYDKKIVNGYMLSMWLSHDKDLIDIVQKMNFLQFSIDDNLIYKYYFNMVPKGKRFLKWTKKRPIDKKEADEIKKLKDRYNISTNEAKSLLFHMKKTGELDEN